MSIPWMMLTASVLVIGGAVAAWAALLSGKGRAFFEGLPSPVFCAAATMLILVANAMQLLGFEKLAPSEVASRPWMMFVVSLCVPLFLILATSVIAGAPGFLW